MKGPRRSHPDLPPQEKSGTRFAPPPQTDFAEEIFQIFQRKILSTRFKKANHQQNLGIFRPYLVKNVDTHSILAFFFIKTGDPPPT